MTMPNGFEIAQGYVTIKANIDKSQMNKTASDAGDSAGESFSSRFSDKLKAAKGRFSSAGQQVGSHFSEGFDKHISGKFNGLLSKISGMFKGLGKDSGSFFSNSFTDKAGLALKALGGQMSAILLPAAVALGPLLGAALGSGIISGIGLGGIAAGIFYAARDPKVKAAGKEFRNNVFGMSKEDIKQLEDDAKKTTDRIAALQAKRNLAKPGSTSTEKINSDLDAAKAKLQGIRDEQSKIGTSVFEQATKSFIPVTLQAIGTLNKMFETIAPNLTTIFQTLAPSVTTLTQGVSGMITALMPGLTNIIKASGPFLTLISDSFTRIGEAVNRFFNKLASDPEALQGMQKALGDLIGLVESLINWLGDLILSTSRAYAQFKNVWGAIANWFSGTIVPSWQRAWSQIRGAVSAVLNWFASIPGWFQSVWNGIKNIWNSALAAVVGLVGSRIATLKAFFGGLRDTIGNIFSSISGKFTSFKNNAIAIFTKVRDGIGSIWAGVKDKLKGPVNFLISPVYSSLRNLWNKAASVIPGVTNLPEIKQFNRGGIAPGYGNTDTVPAMLTPGEGILTKEEMKKIGGAKGFARLRQEIQYYNDGGIVGGIKDWVGGKLKAAGNNLTQFFRGSLYPGAKALADKFVYPAIAKMSNKGFAKLPRQGAINLVNGALNWLKKDDSQNSSGATGVIGNGHVMGWRNMLAAINRAGFNFHPSLGQTTGGTHARGSYHYQGRAVDLSPPSMKAFNWILSTYGKNIKELIYGPAGGRSIKNGNPHNYSRSLMNQHYNHIHWAMDNGGVLPPKSTSMVTNATSQREFALTEDKLKNIAGPTNVFNEGAIVISVRDDDDMREIKAFFGDMRKGYNAGLV